MNCHAQNAATDSTPRPSAETNGPGIMPPAFARPLSEAMRQHMGLCIAADGMQRRAVRGRVNLPSALSSFAAA
jgi:hypothetical protein